MLRLTTMSIALMAVAVVATAGGGMTREFRAYKGKVPLSETTLFFTIDDRNMQFEQSTLLKVDGQGTGFMGPARSSARVLPGSHNFVVKAVWDFSASVNGSTGGITASSTFHALDLDIEVKDMRPRHVYVVRYRFEKESVAWRVEDLGERATYSPSVFAAAF